MGQIQNAVNAMLGGTAAGASVAKGIKMAKQSIQEQMGQRAEKAKQDAIDYKLKQQQLKGQRLENRKARLDIKLKKQELGGKQ